MILRSPSTRRLAGMMLLCAALAGCAGLSGGSAGELRAVSLSEEPVALASRYDAAVYTKNTSSVASIMLSNLSIEQLLSDDSLSGQVMHVELLWIPKAGATPLDPSATNATIRLVVVANGEVGVYGGAGFAVPSGNVDSGPVHVSVRDATVRLLESTAGFYDKLSPAHVTGSFTAALDEKSAVRYQRAVAQFVTAKFERRMYVQIDPRSAH